MDLFNLGIDYLATKVSMIFLFISTILNFKSLFATKHFLRYLIPLLVYFILLTARSYSNRSSPDQNYFDFLFFLNAMIFTYLISVSKINEKVILNGLFSFALGNIGLTILYFLNIGVSDLDGRDTIFNMNQNFLGISLCITFFIFISIIIENRLNFSKYRILLIFLLPLLLLFIMRTGSRVSLISIALGILLFLFFNKSIGFLKRILLQVAVFFVFILCWQFFLKDSIIIERLNDTINDGDLANRDIIWDNLITFFSDNFYLGVGKTGYDNISGGGSPHNVILEVFLYTGIVGVCIFLIFYIMLVNVAVKKLKYKSELLPIVLIIPVTGLILTGQIFDHKFIWFVFAYIAGNIVKNNSPVLISVVE